MTRTLIASSLVGEHVRPDWRNPAFHFTVMVADKADRDGLQYTRQCANITNDTDELPSPLEYCLIGTNFQSEDGRVHFLALDFDGPNHGVGHSAETLARIIEACKQVPWLHIYRSRSGNGYHVGAPLGRDIRADLNDGAVMALGNRMIEIIGAEIGEPELAKYVCKAGSVMFIQAPDAPGFQLIKAATTVYPGPVEPLYRGGKFSGDPAKLDDDHRRLIDWLHQHAKCDVIQDGPFWKVHTTDLAAAHKALGLRGEFHTKSIGGQDHKPNAWMVPQEHGQWLVGRFGKYEDWSTHNNYSYCVLNPFLNLEEFAEKIGSDYWTMEEAREFCTQLGQTFPDPGINVTCVRVRRTNAGIEFAIDVPCRSSARLPWRPKNKSTALWIIRQPKEQKETSIRVCYSRGGKGTLVYQQLHRDYWHLVPTEHAKMYLEGDGFDKFEIARILTTSTPIELVNEPFKPEWLSTYRWNHDAVQLAFEPAATPGPYQHWQMILDHIGRGLDVAVKTDDWCLTNGITTGARYLMYWDARVIREPKRRLPMLCLYSPMQNTGKSIQFQKFRFLITKSGYCLAEKALITGFNADLKNCIIADLDDVDLSPHGARAYQTLLPILTGDEIKIVGKGKDQIQVANSTHWGHTANALRCFQIRPGDTRALVVEVPPLDIEVPREEMDRALIEEAPAYLQALLDLPMPEVAAGRFFLPVLDTRVKHQIIAENTTLSDQQQRWVNEFKRLADANKLVCFAAPDLTDLMDGAPDCYALRDHWAVLATALGADGYHTDSTPNRNAKKPATYSIINQGALLRH